MFDKAFAQWWITCIEPFREVTADKLAADREAMERQQEYNQNYQSFLQSAVLPSIESLTQFLRIRRRRQPHFHRATRLRSGCTSPVGENWSSARAMKMR